MVPPRHVDKLVPSREAAATHPTILSGAAHGEVPFRVLDTWRARLLLPLLGFAEAHLITIRTPMGRKAAAKSRVVPAPLLRVRRAELDLAGVERREARVAGARDGKPALDDGAVLDVANVIWATGFRPDYGWIERPITGADGWPIEHRGVSPERGLYFVGVPFQEVWQTSGAGYTGALASDPAEWSRRVGAFLGAVLLGDSGQMPSE